MSSWVIEVHLKYTRVFGKGQLNTFKVNIKHWSFSVVSVNLGLEALIPDVLASYLLRDKGTLKDELQQDQLSELRLGWNFGWDEGPEL